MNDVIQPVFCSDEGRNRNTCAYMHKYTHTHAMGACLLQLEVDDVTDIVSGYSLYQDS